MPDNKDLGGPLMPPGAVFPNAPPLIGMGSMTVSGAPSPFPEISRPGPSWDKQPASIVTPDGEKIDIAFGDNFSPSDVGFHNQNMEYAKERLLKSNTWKKQEIVFVLPAGKTVSTKCALSWMNLIFPPNNGLVRIVLENFEVGHAYSHVIENILAHPHLSKFKYLLTVEHDNVPTADGVLKLLEKLENNDEYAAVSGLYWTKGESGQPQIWGDISDPVVNYRPQMPKPGKDNLQECYGIGMGFALWRLDMFRDPKLRRPWFRTVASLQEGVGTQDLYYWADARKYGYRCAVACDVLVGHFDQSAEITW